MEIQILQQIKCIKLLYAYEYRPMVYFIDLVHKKLSEEEIQTLFPVAHF